MLDLLDDLRLAMRTLRRRPGFTAVAVLTLALGTGVNAAVFGVLNRTVLRPLEYEAPDRLVSVTTSVPDRSGLGLSIADAAELERTSAVFETVGWVERPSLSTAMVLTGAEAERIAGAWVSASFFDVLGVRPYLGRSFREGEDRAGAGPVALLSHGAWRARWGGDAGVVGRTIEVNGDAVTVIGVLPASLAVPLGGVEPVLWMARPYPPFLLESRDAWIGEVVARLRPGATRVDAQRELDAFMADVRERYPAQHAETRFVAEPLHDRWVGDVRGPLLFLLAGALLVLLVACVNLGILVAGRNAARHGEMAVRRALGAGHARLARSVLAECLVLGVSGTALGVGLALAAAGGIRALSPVELWRMDGSPVDMRFLGFAALMAVGAGLLVGVAPVVRAVRTAPGAVLRSRGRARAGRLGGILVVMECAAVVTLLMGAALATRGLSDLLSTDPGFVPAGRVMARVTLPRAFTWQVEGGSARNFAFFREAGRRVAEVPGVESAGFVTNPPLTPASWGGQLWLRGAPNPSPPRIDWEVAGAGYFEAAGIDGVAGRTFLPGDDADAPFVVVVNETLARLYLPEGGAVGTVITGESAEGPWRTVIGVVADVKQQALGQEETRPQMYIHDLQAYAWGERWLVYHAPGDALARLDGVRRAIREIEPGATVDLARPMTALVDRSAAAARFHSVLLRVFAAIAAVLGVAGVYGVVSDAVDRRRGEIAVRMALGAGRNRVLASELLRGLRPVVIGVMAGVAVGLAGARVARGTVAGLERVDPLLLTVLAASLLGVAVLAVLGPARRAASIAPAAVLREGPP